MRNCESFMTDYERAMKNALKSLYGIDVKYLSCWFHVSQAVKRQASKVDGFFHRGQPALFDRRHLQNIAGRPILTIIFFLHRIRAKGICSFFACFFFYFYLTIFTCMCARIVSFQIYPFVFVLMTSKKTSCYSHVPSPPQHCFAP